MVLIISHMRQPRQANPNDLARTYLKGPGQATTNAAKATERVRGDLGSLSAPLRQL